MTGCQAMPQARHNPGQGGLVSLESPVRPVSPVSLATWPTEPSWQGGLEKGAKTIEFSYFLEEN